LPRPGASRSWSRPKANSCGLSVVGMIPRTSEFAPSAKMVIPAPTAPVSVRTPPEGSMLVTRTSLRMVAPALAAMLANPRSKTRRSRCKARKRKSGPSPEGPPTRSPESSRSTASSGTGRPTRRQIGSTRIVAGLARAPISGAASINKVVAPLWAAALAAQSPARLAPTTKTSTFSEGEFTDKRCRSRSNSRAVQYGVGGEE
jgi:hypothetical protein